MILKQLYLNCLAHASYLIGDEESGVAAVVDPRRDIDIYLAEASQHGMQIRHVFLTHFHADFVAGHLELRKRTGATIYLGQRARAEYEFVPLKDGDVIDLGGVRLQALETPGHTAESISLLVFDRSTGTGEPYAVLTGDTLFVGDVGRPDLRASLGWSATELGKLLFDSLREKLLPLPDHTLVYPAHGAGSLCGKSLSKETVSTIGDQRRNNYALQPMSQSEFVSVVTADQPDAPDYFTYDAILNSKEHATLDDVLERELKPLQLDEVMASNALVLDVRSPADFAKGHLRGSVNIGLDGQYATWAGTVLDRTRPIVIVSDPGREEEAAKRLARIGFDNVAGFLGRGIEPLEGRPDLLVDTRCANVSILDEALASAAPPLVVDVRTPREWQEKHIAGSLNMPLNRLRDHLSELSRDRDTFITCAGGYRSSIAISLFEREGFARLTNLTGGIAAWEAARLPLQHPSS